VSASAWKPTSAAGHQLATDRHRDTTAMTAAGRAGVSGNLLLQPGISLPQTDTWVTMGNRHHNILRLGVPASVETYCGRASACHRQTQGHHGNDCGWACRRQWKPTTAAGHQLATDRHRDTTAMTAAGRVGVSGNLLLRPGISLPHRQTRTPRQ